MEKYKTLDEALTDLGWFHLDNIETNTKEVVDSLNEILDFTNRDNEGTPAIKTKQKTIIVCDNHDFNETYLIDLVSALLKSELNAKPGDYQLIYLDNVSGRLYLQNPTFIQYIDEKDYKIIERTKLFPQIIVVNPDCNAVVSVNETIITQITEEMVSYLLKYLDNGFCKKIMSK